MEENNKIRETLKEMEERIKEINKIADEKIATANKESAAKIDEIRNNTIDVIENAMNQIKSTVDEEEITYNFKFEEFLNRVISRSKEATTYTVNKIKEYSESSQIEEKLNDATNQINDAFDKLIANDDIQNAYDKTKSFTKKSIDDVNEYFNNKDFQKHVDSFTDALVSSVHGLANGLEHLLKGSSDSDCGLKTPEHAQDVAEEVKEKATTTNHDFNATKETIIDNLDDSIDDSETKDNTISIDDIKVDDKD